MSQTTIEDIYDALARMIDEAGALNSEIYLAKTCLALAEALNDPDRALEIVTACGLDLTQ